MSFKPTHKILVKATEINHSYDVIVIDINSGYFKKANVKQELTKIRVRDMILAEELSCHGSQGLTLEQALEVTNEFNAKRVSLGFNPVIFYRLESVD